MLDNIRENYYWSNFEDKNQFEEGPGVFSNAPATSVNKQVTFYAFPSFYLYIPPHILLMATIRTQSLHFLSTPGVHLKGSCCYRRYKQNIYLSRASEEVPSIHDVPVVYTLEWVIPG